MTAEIAISVLLGFGAFILAYIGSNLDDEHIIMKIGLSLTSLFMLLVSFSAGITFAESISEQLVKIVTIGYWLMGITIFLIFLYWCVYFIKKTAESIKWKKEHEYDE